MSCAPGLSELIGAPRAPPGAPRKPDGRRRRRQENWGETAVKGNTVLKRLQKNWIQGIRDEVAKKEREKAEKDRRTREGMERGRQEPMSSGGESDDDPDGLFEMRLPWR